MTYLGQCNLAVQERMMALLWWAVFVVGAFQVLRWLYLWAKAIWQWYWDEESEYLTLDGDGVERMSRSTFHDIHPYSKPPHLILPPNRRLGGRLEGAPGLSAKRDVIKDGNNVLREVWLAYDRHSTVMHCHSPKELLRLATTYRRSHCISHAKLCQLAAILGEAERRGYLRIEIPKNGDVATISCLAGFIRNPGGLW